MFSRFKEKLSGFKEALSSKIAEKVSQEKVAGTVNGRSDSAAIEDENGAQGIRAEAKVISPPAEKGSEVKRSSGSFQSTLPAGPLKMILNFTHIFFSINDTL